MLLILKIYLLLTYLLVVLAVGHGIIKEKDAMRVEDILGSIFFPIILPCILIQVLFEKFNSLYESASVQRFLNITVIKDRREPIRTEYGVGMRYRDEQEGAETEEDEETFQIEIESPDKKSFNF